MQPTLILLPGLVCDAAVWTPQVAALQAQAQCVVPAYGLRDTLTAMAEQVLSEAPAERFSLAGHSMGGRVALEVMRLAPQRVQRLALMDTGTQPLAAGEAGEKERAGRLELLALARAKGMRAMADKWARGMVHPERIDTPLFESVLDILARSSPGQFAAQINALLTRPDASTLLPTIQCPTLVLCGREDSWSTPAQHAQMRDAIPNAALCVIEHCGHMCTLEQPQAVTDALAAWLQR
ncbi:MAG: alpha/beta hydrolase [Rhodoferax sp.]|uniref:alpha/beta fold hydrolase n=1 Tax=Rhodoferax sp. TaxID=50421 RepID=UPI0027253E8E|nr:alpha/beta hydrolase [Rhodoferax sp.]MDO8447700.1 alpha/beta hydrolase [Rhodoferax sp.]